MANVGFVLCFAALVVRPKCRSEEGDDITPAFLCSAVFWFLLVLSLAGMLLSMLGKNGDLSRLCIGIAGIAAAMGCASLAIRPFAPTDVASKPVVQTEVTKPPPRPSTWPTFLYLEIWKQMPKKRRVIVIMRKLIK